MPKTPFPWKKAIRSTIIILLVALLALALLETIALHVEKGAHQWIFLLVWGIIFGVLLVGYWIKLVYGVIYKPKMKEKQNHHEK